MCVLKFKSIEGLQYFLWIFENGPKSAVRREYGLEISAVSSELKNNNLCLRQDV